MRVVFFSNHWYQSPRRAGFHHMAAACRSLGHEVAFATVGLSWLSYARRDFRTRYEGLRQARGKLVEVQPGLESYVHFTPWHPHTSLIPSLDRFLGSYFRRYERFSLGPLLERVRKADAIIYESCCALYLVRMCRSLAPGAKHVYRVSDDIRILRSTPQSMVELEREVAPLFDLISTPCRYLQTKFFWTGNAHLHSHGVAKELFDAAAVSPYTGRGPHCVFLGVGFFDSASVALMARENPEASFHIIGLKQQPSMPENVLFYGEMPFESTVPYIKFADVGLYTLSLRNRHAAAFTDSLKIQQYRYCGLPIVSPDFLDLSREGVFFYTPGCAASCGKALRQAVAHGKHLSYAQEVLDWRQVVQKLLAD